MKNFFIFLSFLITAVLILFLSNHKTLHDDRHQVTVSIPPLKYFVDRIGSNHIKTMIMVTPGLSPATYSPTPQQMTKLAKSKIYFRIGVPFEEAWMNKIQELNSQMKVIDVREHIEINKSDECEDPHVWTSPILAKTIAHTILKALIHIDPKNKAEFKKNYHHLVEDLNKLNTVIQKKLAPFRGQTFYVFHPAWDYYATAYDLHQDAIEKEGKEPSPQELESWIDNAKNKHVKVIFVQKQFSQKESKMIAKLIGATLVEVDPLAEDYIKNLEHFTDILTQTLKSHAKHY